MIDIHTHILPGMDDGAIDWNMSLSMLRIAESQGITNMVATPHVIDGNWLPEWQAIEQKCLQLQAMAKNAGLAITIHPGAEVAVQLDILERLIKPGPYCINGKNYILVELPSREIPNYAETFFFTLQTRGMTPILAHAERHPEIIGKPQILVDWMQRGLMVQLNLPSLMGAMGEKVKKTAELLLYNNLPAVIGTDAHNNRTRRPLLSEAAVRIISQYGIAYAETLFRKNPLTILDGGDLARRENIILKSPDGVDRKEPLVWWEKIKNCF